MRHWLLPPLALLCAYAITPATAQDCGSDALQAMLALSGKSVPVDQVRSVLGTRTDGLSLADLRRGALKFGLRLEGRSVPLREVADRGCCAILYLHQPDHFMTVSGIADDSVMVVESGLLRVQPLDTVASRYSGIALLPASAVAGKAALWPDRRVCVVDFTGAGQTCTKQIPLTNRGAKPLVVRVERASCSCTDAALSTTSVPVGGTASLTVTVRPRAWGTSAESVELSTSDETAPRLVIVFVIRMAQHVVPQPSHLPLRTTEGNAVRASLSLSVGEGFVLQGWSCRQPFLTARELSKRPVGGGVQHDFEVTVEPSAPPGPFSDEISFRVANSEVPFVSVPVRGFIEPDVTASPKQVFFGMMAAGSTAKRRVAIRSAAGRPFALKPVVGKDSRISVKGDWGPKSASHEISVDVAAKGDPGSMLRETVQLTLEDGRSVQFGVFAMIGGAGEAGGKQ